MDNTDDIATFWIPKIIEIVVTEWLKMYGLSVKMDLSAIVEHIANSLDFQLDDDDDDQFEYYISIRNQTFLMLYYTHSYFCFWIIICLSLIHI